MKDISTSKDLSDYEKVLQHSEALQRYLNHFNRAHTIPKKSAAIGNETRSVPAVEQLSHKKGQTDEAVPETKHEKKIPFSADNILSSFTDKTQKESVSSLLDRLKKSTRVSWDRLTGKVSVDGSKLRGVGITFLLKDAVSTNGKQSGSKGAIRFRNALDELKIQDRGVRYRKQTGSGLKSRIDRRLLRQWYKI